MAKKKTIELVRKPRKKPVVISPPLHGNGADDESLDFVFTGNRPRVPGYVPDALRVRRTPGQLAIARLRISELERRLLEESQLMRHGADALEAVHNESIANEARLAEMDQQLRDSLRTVDSLITENSSLRLSVANWQHYHNEAIANNQRSQANLRLLQSRERSYLDRTWDLPETNWKGFDIYVFGWWVSLRRTPSGWSFKSNGLHRRGCQSVRPDQTGQCEHGPQ